jgi:hypothetical protein
MILFGVVRPAYYSDRFEVKYSLCIGLFMFDRINNLHPHRVKCSYGKPVVEMKKHSYQPNIAIYWLALLLHIHGFSQALRKFPDYTSNSDRTHTLLVYNLLYTNYSIIRRYRQSIFGSTVLLLNFGLFFSFLILETVSRTP